MATAKKIERPATLFQEWYRSHREEMQSHYLFFPYLVNHTIGQTCLFDPAKDEYKEKIFTILERWGYGGIGGTEQYHLVKQRRSEMYHFVCEYYKWYMDHQRNSEENHI